MTNILREFTFSSEYLYKVLSLVMAFDLSSLTDLDRHTFNKVFSQSLLFIDYIPFLGPLYNAALALNLLFNLWPTSKDLELVEENEETEVQKAEAALEKSRLIRVKGMTAVATALIDLLTLCLTVGVIAFVYDCLVRISAYALVRYALVLAVLATGLALTIGSKVVTGQLVESLSRQLEDVGSVSVSMVKSVSITATAIEKIVETTNTRTNAFVGVVTDWWAFFIGHLLAVIFFPRNVYREVMGKVDRQVALTKYQVRRVRYQCRRMVMSTSKKLLPFKGLLKLMKNPMGRKQSVEVQQKQQ